MHEVKRIIKDIKANVPDHDFLKILSFINDNKEEINTEYLINTPMDELCELARAAREISRRSNSNDANLLIPVVSEDSPKFSNIMEFV